MRDFGVNSQEDIMRYFVRWHDGRLKRSEERKLEAWLNASSDNRNKWEQISQVWKVGELLTVPDANPAEEQWQTIRQKINRQNRAAIQRRNSAPARSLKSPYRPAIYALAVLGIVMAGFAIFERFDTRIIQRTAAHGQKLTLDLPDNTIVELGPGSTLNYRDSFAGEERRVSLVGEAFFSVTIGEKPFVVETELLEVRVTGTAFNVRAWDEVTRVYVQEGSVETTSRERSGLSLRISPGQVGVLQNDSLYIDKEAIEAEILGWRQGRIFFRETPFVQVLADLERAYDVKLTADDNLIRHTITASFEAQATDEILDVLAQAIGAQVVRTDFGYRFSPK